MESQVIPQKSRWPAIVALVMIAVTNTWPWIHGALSSPRDTGWSPWKLIGFGMFVEPQMYHNHIAVILIEEPGTFGEGASPDIDLAKYLKLNAWRGTDLKREPFEVVRVSGTEIQNLSSSEKDMELGKKPSAGAVLMDSAPGAHFHQKVTDVQCFYNNKEYIRNLAETTVKGTESLRKGPVARSVVIVSKPRVNVKERYHYGSMCAFVVTNDGEVTQKGCWMGDNGEGSAVIQRLGL
jgi:hypothetical protein